MPLLRPGPPGSPVTRHGSSGETIEQAHTHSPPQPDIREVPDRLVVFSASGPRGRGRTANDPLTDSHRCICARFCRRMERGRCSQATTRTTDSTFAVGTVISPNLERTVQLISSSISIERSEIGTRASGEVSAQLRVEPVVAGCRAPDRCVGMVRGGGECVCYNA